MGFNKSSAKLIIASTIIDNDVYEFEWKYFDNDDDNPSFLEINLPNLAQELKNKLTKGTTALFEFGFGNITGTLINGYVDKVTTEVREGVTEITKIKILEIDPNGFKQISKSYKNKKISFIITDIANELGYILKTLDLESDILMQTGYVAYGKGINILKKLTEQAGSNIRFEGNLINIFDINDNVKSKYQLVKFGNGLLKIPSEIEEDGKEYNYIIEMLASPEIRKNSILKVETKVLSSFCKVIKLELDNWVARYFVKVMEV